jgi:hypothetical protein
MMTESIAADFRRGNFLWFGASRCNPEPMRSAEKINRIRRSHIFFFERPIRLYCRCQYPLNSVLVYLINENYLHQLGKFMLNFLYMNFNAFKHDQAREPLRRSFGMVSVAFHCKYTRFRVYAPVRATTQVCRRLHCKPWRALWCSVFSGLLEST